jgi:hypothetical protein
VYLVENEAALLAQIQKVPLVDYQCHRQRLAEAEAPHQFFYHHVGLGTAKKTPPTRPMNCSWIKLSGG